MSDQPKTLFTTVTAYLDSLHQKNQNASTVKIYERCLNLALDYFGGERQLSNILPIHVGKFFNSDLLNKNPKTGAPRAQATIKQNKRVFRQCLEFALEQGYIENSPVPRSELEHARSRKKPPKTGTPLPETGEQAVSQS